jgi:DNA replicative helicase MCM subunit Mcm2 (Cdc46/Mcm family)
MRECDSFTATAIMHCHSEFGAFCRDSSSSHLRQLEAIARIAESRAKMRRDPDANEYDVMMAAGMVNACFIAPIGPPMTL